MGKEEFALFGNGYRENISFTIDAGVSVTCHFGKHTESDTATDKYYDIKFPTKKVSIKVNQIATITHIQNKELKSPITLGTAAANTFSEGIEWSQVTVRADVDATTFEVYAS